MCADDMMEDDGVVWHCPFTRFGSIHQESTRKRFLDSFTEGKYLTILSKLKDLLIATRWRTIPQLVEMWVCVGAAVGKSKLFWENESVGKCLYEV